MTDKPTKSDFFAAYAAFIIGWNHLEQMARGIVANQAGGNIWANIMSKSVGNVDVTDLLVTASNWTPEAQSHLVHFAKLIDTIRPYRNYYVHCLLDVGTNAEVGALGIVMSMETKRKFEIAEKALTVSELDRMRVFMRSATEYGRQIDELLAKPSDTRREDFLKLVKPEGPLPLKKKFRLGLN